MAVRFKKGINWDYYGVDILKYDYLSAKGGAKANRDNFINTEEMRKELNSLLHNLW